MIELSSKYPDEMSKFEKDKLRSLLFEHNGLAPELIERLNPPLSWISVLQDWKILDSAELQSSWITRNFDDPRSVHDIAGIIDSLLPKLGQSLEDSVKNFDHKNNDLKFCWDLVSSQIKNNNLNSSKLEWFRIMQQLEQGDCSNHVIERIIVALTPAIVVKQKRNIKGKAVYIDNFQKPSELISIKFNPNVAGDINKFYATWVSKSKMDDSKNLLVGLNKALNQTLETAICAGIEYHDKIGITDRKILSIARHKQDFMQEGIYKLVRVVADIWELIAKEDEKFAYEVAKGWSESKFRLVRRLALFASANPIILRSFVFRLLKLIPDNQLFIGSSRVEVYRLIKSRWKNFTKAQKLMIERRIIQGPKAKLSEFEAKEQIDRCVFNLLGYMNQIKLELSDKSYRKLEELKSEYQDWNLVAKERAGFLYWREWQSATIEDPKPLSDLASGEIIETVKKMEKKDVRLAERAWRKFCNSNLDDALTELTNEANTNVLSTSYWRIFFEEASMNENNITKLRIIESIEGIPEHILLEITYFVADWLKSSSESIKEVELIFKLWDRLFKLLPNKNLSDTDIDLVENALFGTAGALVDTLIAVISDQAKLTKYISSEITKRFEKLYNLSNLEGIYSKVSLTKSIGTLFKKFPSWVKIHIIPLLEWSNPIAIHCWSTLNYVNWISNPEIFKVVKKPFLKSFKQTRLKNEEINLFVRILIYMFIVDSSQGETEIISYTDARTAIRNGGVRCLPEFSRILANEMTQTNPENKIVKWEKSLGPIFNYIWPLDYDIQTQDSNRDLVRLLCESGDAFSIVANDIGNIPALQPNTNRNDFSLLSFSEIDKKIIEKSPEQALNVVYKIVGEQPENKEGLEELLEYIGASCPKLATSPKYWHLTSFLE